jgi:hypothetical protein
MSHYIQITVLLSERLSITCVQIDENTTDLENDSELIKMIAVGLLKSIHANKEDLMIQDLLNSVNIKREK